MLHFLHTYKIQVRSLFGNIKTTYTNPKRLKQNKPKALKSQDKPNHSFETTYTQINSRDLLATTKSRNVMHLTFQSSGRTLH
jgi:hypothetical protein